VLGLEFFGFDLAESDGSGGYRRHDSIAGQLKELTFFILGKHLGHAEPPLGVAKDAPMYYIHGALDKQFI
jgi:hypothetical protein